MNVDLAAGQLDAALFDLEGVLAVATGVTR
jgi:hypothetical protein